jgi:hyperosmotically inducible protein
MKLERTSYVLAACAVLSLGAAGCGTLMGNPGGKQTTDTSENRRGPVVTTEDAVINGKVKTALAANEMVKARKIDADTVRGVVTLNGSVGSAAEKAEAIRIARSIDGVKDVRDNLKAGG